MSKPQVWRTSVNSPDDGGLEGVALCSHPSFYNDQGRDVHLPVLGMQMEVGIEDCLHIEFEYDKSRYHLKDTVVGKIYFLLVRAPASPKCGPVPVCADGRWHRGLLAHRV